jgi:hypothetical protein
MIYKVDDITDEEFAKLQEIQSRYVDLYKLDNYNIDRLPDYHNDLLAKAGKIYDEMIDGSSNIKNDMEIKQFLDKRLDEYGK